MKNQTFLSGFLLLRLTDSTVLLGLQAVLFSLVYLVSTLENLTIVLLTVLDRHLHTPMYFFLRHLSFLDLCLISTTLPKSILNSITLSNAISFLGCVCQLFLMVLLLTSEVGTLTAMSYDRYVAICHPLHYEGVMSKGFCFRLMAVSWLSGVVFGILYSAGTFSLEFCGSNRFHQFFCDVPALLQLTCSEQHAAVSVSVGCGALYGFSCLVCIVISYVFIFSTVLKMPSRESRSKSFSTCVPHLVVLGTFLLIAALCLLKETEFVFVDRHLDSAYSHSHQSSRRQGELHVDQVGSMSPGGRCVALGTEPKRRNVENAVASGKALRPPVRSRTTFAVPSCYLSMDSPCLQILLL
ncbi:Olfactory receptor 14K1 [Fukomys damarensis]|uniref:Olfactory receptor n=1 Tax=Fukomys damarensis TaxID=885580 RepID=A0A091DZR9_FUKDA|nr:Olfactory receptor 14K1 [Fukomys damarensis]